MARFCTSCGTPLADEIARFCAECGAAVAALPTPVHREFRRSSFVSLCVGGIVGVLLVRALFLDPIEELGWRMFCAAIGDGRGMDLGMVVNSTAFAKCLTGLVLGAGAGFFLASAFNRRLSTQAQGRNE
jgi:hypothetical protein